MELLPTGSHRLLLLRHGRLFSIQAGAGRAGAIWTDRHGNRLPERLAVFVAELGLPRPEHGEHRPAWS